MIFLINDESKTRNIILVFLNKILCIVLKYVTQNDVCEKNIIGIEKHFKNKYNILAARWQIVFLATSNTDRSQRFSVKGLVICVSFSFV